MNNIGGVPHLGGGYLEEITKQGKNLIGTCAGCNEENDEYENLSRYAFEDKKNL